MGLATPKYQKFGALTPRERQQLYAVLDFDQQCREVAQFAKGNVVETPMGLYKVRRSYDRGRGYVPDRRGMVSGWRYECIPVTADLPGGRPRIFATMFRTYREDQLLEWNPMGAIVETANIFVVPPIPPIVRPKLLVGATMDQLLLPAWSSDVRVVAGHFLKLVTARQ